MANINVFMFSILLLSLIFFISQSQNILIQDEHYTKKCKNDVDKISYMQIILCLKLDSSGK